MWITNSTEVYLNYLKREKYSTLIDDQTLVEKKKTTFYKTRKYEDDNRSYIVQIIDN